jgi:hypothetical protein
VREVAGEQLHSLTGPRASSTYAAVEKTSHHRTVADLEKKPEPEAPLPDASLAEKRRHRLQTAEGKTLYKLRQQTVEPVAGTSWSRSRIDGRRNIHSPALAVTGVINGRPT